MAKQRFAGKIALVTGCGAAGPGWGNGKATAVLLARDGAKVFGCDIDLRAAEETRDLIRKEGAQCEVRVTDVGKTDQVKALVDDCIEHFGRIDVLVNNVGISGNGGPVECPEDKWRRDLDVNITSMFLTCKYVLPHMERQGGGSIVNISSLSAIRSVSVSSVSYDTTKAAVLGFSRSVALRYAKRNIRSNVVLPGLIRTPTAEQVIGDYVEQWGKQPPMGLPGEAWDIAEAVLYLASDAAKYVTATELIVDGGLAAKMAVNDGSLDDN